MTVNYSKLKEEDAYFEALGDGLWLMDDHRWALIAWEQAAVATEKPYVLVHADYHWDGCYDSHDSPAEEALLTLAAAPALYQLVKAANWIRYDSFIAPAIVRGLVGEVHFYCKQQDQYDIGIDGELLRRFAASQHFHDTPATLALVAPGRPLIFDLCLDLFNRPDKNNKMYEGVLWSNDEVMAYLEAVKGLVQRARVVTVSLSFGYSGTEADTRHLAQLVLPHLQAWRRERDCHAAQ
jgi:hypothetical protein